MSNDIAKKLVLDDRLNVSDKIGFQIYKGPQSNNMQTFSALSQSNSSHQFSIQVPSEMTIINRVVYWKCTVVLKLTKGTAGARPAGEYMVNYGLQDALASMPLHQLCSTLQATINSTTVSVNIRDVLPAIQRMFPQQHLGEYNSLAPVYLDNCRIYQDLVGANNNALGAYGNSADPYLVPRGAWALDSFIASDTAFTVPAVPSDDTVYVKFTSVEPLMLSPFVYGPNSKEQGFYGIQNMNFTFNIGDAKRCFRSASKYWNGIDIVSFTGSELQFNMLTASPNTILPSRNVIPYYELPRFISQTGTIAVATKANGLLTPATLDLNSNSLQLNQIPQYAIIYARKSQASQTVNDPDFFCPIQQISIQFNNVSGILASATKEQLFAMSKENCLNMNWQEFSGKANKIGNGQINQFATVGAPLILEFGKDIPLVEPYYSIGSLINANLQVKVKAENYDENATVATELVIVLMNVGVFTSERGNSATFLSPVSKQDVLDVANDTPVPASDVKRMVGYGFLDNLKTMLASAMKNPSKVVEAVCSVAKPLASAVSGEGMSGGMMRRLKK